MGRTSWRALDSTQASVQTPTLPSLPGPVTPLTQAQCPVRGYCGEPGMQMVLNKCQLLMSRGGEPGLTSPCLRLPRRLPPAWALRPPSWGLTPPL